MEDENVDLNGDETVTTEWIGNQVAFNIGERPVKIWELLLGIVVLAIILPLLIFTFFLYPIALSLLIFKLSFINTIIKYKLLES